MKLGRRKVLVAGAAIVVAAAGVGAAFSDFIEGALAALILLVLLTGPTLLSERRSGRVIMLLAALFAVGMPVLHFSLAADLTKHSAALFFVWCLIALGVNGLFSVLLWVSELRRMRSERRADA